MEATHKAALDAVLLLDAKMKDQFAGEGRVSTEFIKGVLSSSSQAAH
jgi:hypothetical protein